MSPASALVLLVLAVVASGCSPAENGTRLDSDLLAACEVTDIALASNTSDDRPWFLSDAAPRRGDDWRTEDVVLQVPKAGEDPDWYIGWHSGMAGGGTPMRTDGPSVDMARAFALSTPVNGRACPNVRAHAERASRSFTHIPGTASTGDEAGFSKAEVMLDRAVVSPDGREAIVYLGQQFAPLAGGGYLILYRREAQGWTEAARLPLWVS